MNIAAGALRLSQSGAADKTEEEALVRRSKHRDLEAFGRLVDAYQARVLGFVKRMVRSQEEAEDVAQETFVKAFTNIHRFDGRASFNTWLFKIAANLCIDRARKRERRPELQPLDAINMEDAKLQDNRWDPQVCAVASEMELTIEQAISELSDKLRAVLLLHDLEGLSYDEIAEVMKLPVGTVKSRLFLARARLQSALSQFVSTGDAS